MKYKAILLIAAVAGITLNASASQMRIGSPATDFTGLSADGTSLTDYPASSWTFEVGYFNSGFNPQAADFSAWNESWTSFTSAEWITAPAFLANKFESSFPLNDSSFTGQNGFIWGFNQKTDLASAEWVLVTHDAWVFPEVNLIDTTLRPENNWSIGADGVEYVVGTQLADGFQMQAIPEPSTYALIFGLGILGFLGYRRVRK